MLFKKDFSELKSFPNRKQEFKVRPWPKLRGLEPIYLPDDPVEKPFLISTNPNRDQQYNDNPNIQLIRTSSDCRKQWFKYNGSAAEAITAALEAEGRL